jgi:hypothetical protein
MLPEEILLYPFVKRLDVVQGPEWNRAMTTQLVVTEPTSLGFLAFRSRMKMSVCTSWRQEGGGRAGAGEEL